MFAAAKTRVTPQAQTLKSIPVPAPIRGMNTVLAGTAIPPGYGIYIYNLISGEYGLRVRSGSTEWVTQLTGGSVAEARTGIGVQGAPSSGSADRLFWTTQSGIWPATSSTAAPAIVVSFGTTTGDAGWGISHACKNIAANFEQYAFYCDEVNGAYRYASASNTWLQMFNGVVPWSGTTAYLIGDSVSNDSGKIYVCDTNGTSAATGGPTGAGANIVDGTTRWDYSSTGPTSGVIYESLADQRSGFSANPANFAFVTEWKGRMWFVEKDSSWAWYLGLGAVSGLATRFDFGMKMQHGGPLAGLYPWAYDGGGGVDSLLVAISTAGDVLAYQGTDPSSATTFGIKGSWYVGGVPKGRRLATHYGGEMLILSNLGVVPLSKLVAGASIEDENLYKTKDIANLFSFFISSRRTMRGWALYLHPEDNVLVVTVPIADGAPTEQLLMSFATGGWSRYRDLPALSMCEWAGRLYFGTIDGRICINTGTIDDVTLASPDVYSPIEWSVLTAYADLGNANQKQIRMLRPSVLSQTPNSVVEASALYDLDLNEPTPPSGTSSTGVSLWDTAIWDVDIWGGNYSASHPLQGATGLGREIAVAVRGRSTSRTAYVKTDVFFAEGGML